MWRSWKKFFANVMEGEDYQSPKYHVGNDFCQRTCLIDIVFRKVFAETVIVALKKALNANRCKRGSKRVREFSTEETYSFIFSIACFHGKLESLSRYYRNYASTNIMAKNILEQGRFFEALASLGNVSKYDIPEVNTDLKSIIDRFNEQGSKLFFVPGKSDTCLDDFILNLRNGMTELIAKRVYISEKGANGVELSVASSSKTVLSFSIHVTYKGKSCKDIVEECIKLLSLDYTRDLKGTIMYLDRGYLDSDIIEFVLKCGWDLLCSVKRAFENPCTWGAAKKTMDQKVILEKGADAIWKWKRTVNGIDVIVTAVRNYGNPVALFCSTQERHKLFAYNFEVKNPKDEEMDSEDEYTNLVVTDSENQVCCRCKLSRKNCVEFHKAMLCEPCFKAVSEDNMCIACKRGDPSHVCVLCKAHAHGAVFECSTAYRQEMKMKDVASSA